MQLLKKARCIIAYANGVKKNNCRTKVMIESNKYK